MHSPTTYFAIGLCVGYRLSNIMNNGGLDPSSFVGQWPCVEDVSAAAPSGRGGMTPERTSTSLDDEKSSPVGLVDCDATADVPPVNLGQMANSVKGVAPHTISFGWWDRRITTDNFRRGRPVRANPTVKEIQGLLRDTPDGAALVDVGANVGFMTFAGTALGRPVVAVDPISYDIAKICEGYRANRLRGMAPNTSSSFRLFHAAAGPWFRRNVTILRNADEVGFFDQSSISKEVFGERKDMVEEVIPMVKVDDIVPEDIPVGVVKIDVQGVEHGVIMGMSKLISRARGFPKYVFFEDDDTAVKQAGYEPGESRKFLQDHGYTCERKGHDTLCKKEA